MSRPTHIYVTLMTPSGNKVGDLVLDVVRTSEAGILVHKGPGGTRKEDWLVLIGWKELSRVGEWNDRFTMDASLGFEKGLLVF